jgi:hypothetical protein
VTSEFLLVDSFAIGIRKRDTDQNYTQGLPKNKSYQFGILNEKSLQLLKNLKNNTPVDIGIRFDY